MRNINLHRLPKLGNFIRLPLVLATLLIILVVGGLIINRRPKVDSSTNTTTLGLTKDGKIEVKPAKATQDVNQSFEITLENNLSPLQMEIQKAELRDEVIIQGKRANTVTGRTYLIISLKIINSNNTSLSLNTRNFLRLSVNGNENEWLAPEIHNDPVEVQASSTKYTRLGFPLNETDSSLILRAGKLEGDKITIPLDGMK